MKAADSFASASPALWWLHALHHGSQRLVTVNNFRYHPLNYAINQALSLLPLMLLGTPEAHRWHRSNRRAEGDSNFGNALLLWDHVFGTYRSVRHAAHAPTQIGLYAPSHYPARAGYVQQLLSMCTPRCCKAGAA